MRRPYPLWATSIQAGGRVGGTIRQKSPAHGEPSAAYLLEQTHVVATRPVLDDHTVGHAPDMDERPRRCPSRSLVAGEERHGRVPVCSVQGEVLGDQVALANEVVLLDDDRPEV